MMPALRRAAVVAVLPLALAPAAGCDLVTADLKHKETAQWRKSYTLQPGGQIVINNVNGKIDVQPSNGNAVDVVVEKSARGATPEAAKQALERIEIRDEVSPSSVKIETKIQRTGDWFGSGEAHYTLRVPNGTEMRFTTVNGGVELRGLEGRVVAETTNGGITARDMAGNLEAVTTNGGVDVELAELGERGARLECTNGGIKLRLPSTAKATISASITNGGIQTNGLELETTESTRRRLEARLNGGGAPIRISGTNGGIVIGAR